MRINHLTTEAIQLSPRSEKARAWIEKVYARYPQTWQNNHVMIVGGEGDDAQFAMFELTPSMSKHNAVEVKWFQAYPLRQGVGTRAMRTLQDLASEDGVALTLYPWDKGRVSQTKLTKFYRNTGFKPTANGAKTMIWEPSIDESSWRPYADVDPDENPNGRLRQNPLQRGPRKQEKTRHTDINVNVPIWGRFLLSGHWQDRLEERGISIESSMRMITESFDKNRDDILELAPGLRFMIRDPRKQSMIFQKQGTKDGRPWYIAITMLPQGVDPPDYLPIDRVFFTGATPRSMFKESLSHKDPVEKWVAIFKASKHPKFVGKTPEQREKMARMAQYRAVQNKKTFENMDHSKDAQAVPELKAALLARKRLIKSQADDKDAVYDIINGLMTSIAKAHGISGQTMHDLWVDQYGEIPDTWILHESMLPGSHTPTEAVLARKYIVGVVEIKRQLKKGIKIELEHTTDRAVAREIALDHLGENLHYYDQLKRSGLEEAWLDTNEYGGWITPNRKVEYVQDQGHEAHLRREHGLRIAEAFLAGFVRFQTNARTSTFSIEGQLSALRKTYRIWGQTALNARNVYIDIFQWRDDMAEQGLTPHMMFRPGEGDKPQIIHSFGTKVAEAFDKPYELPKRWKRDSDDAHWKVIKLPDSRELKVQIDYEPNYKIAIWNFWVDDNQKITGKGDAFRVFATAIAALRQFVQSKKPDIVAFMGDDGDPSRIKMYDRLVPWLISQGGLASYDDITDEPDMWPDMLSDFWDERYSMLGKVYVLASNDYMYNDEEFESKLPAGQNLSEAKKRKAKTIIDGMIKSLIKQGRTRDEAIADLKRQVDSRFYEAIDAYAADQILEENLRDWFKQKWVRFSPDGKIRGDCARGSSSEGKPKCLPQSKAHALGKKGRATAARRKRRNDPNPERHGKAKNVRTKESMLEDLQLSPAAVRSLQTHLNTEFDANLDVDGVLGPLTAASIVKFLPSAVTAGAPDPSRSTAVQGGKVKPTLDEKCWDGHHKQGMKTMFGKRVPNCVKTEDIQAQRCPSCGGLMVSEDQLAEKQDACYYKVKSRYKIWPSAYASGALVQCRKKGAKNWGKSKTKESVAENFAEGKIISPPGNTVGLNVFELSPEERQGLNGITVYHQTKKLDKIMQSGGLRPRADLSGENSFAVNAMRAGRDWRTPKGIFVSNTANNWFGDEIAFKIEPSDKIYRAYNPEAGHLLITNPIPTSRFLSVNNVSSSLDQNFTESTAKIKLYTDPNYFGAEVDDSVGDGKPVINVLVADLVGFEPDDKMKGTKSAANMRKMVNLIKSGKGNELPAILVRKYKSGYQVLDGHHRFHAYKAAGATTIPGKIVPDSDIEEISKNKVNEELEEGEGFEQEAGIGIDGKSFKFKIKDLVALADKYPVVKIDPKQFADQIAGREEDEAQSMARMQKADLQYPIIVVKRQNGQLWIADGTHRAHKSILNKLPSINAKVIPIADMSQFAVKESVAEGLDSIPATLYHATYRPLLKSIKKYGLGGDRAQAKWEDSKPGVVYLAVDPNVAESYAEASDVVPEEWLDEIVILKISTNSLDINNFDIDSNVQDNTGDTIQYTGIIPVSNISLVRQGVAEGKVKLYTDPDYYGADVSDDAGAGLPVKQIPLKNLVGFEPDDKMKDAKSAANMANMIRLIKAGKGQQLPPILVRRYKNRYQVLDGHHRFHAYQAAGAKTIPAKLIPADEIEVIDTVPTNENFADGKGPGRPGDSQRHGIPQGATMAQLQKAAKAPGRKGQLARWQINMRRGRKKANESDQEMTADQWQALRKSDPREYLGIKDYRNRKWWESHFKSAMAQARVKGQSHFEFPPNTKMYYMVTKNPLEEGGSPPHGSPENELAMMKARTKPAVTFLDIGQYEEMYEPNMEHYDWIKQKWRLPNMDVNYYVIGQPGQEARIKRIGQLIYDMNKNGKNPTADYHRELGRLLGYSEADIQSFLKDLEQNS